MIRAVEAVHGSLNEAEAPSQDYLSLKADETETNEPVAAQLDEILSRKDSSNAAIQSSVDASGHLRVTRTKTKAKMPVTTEDYRRIMKVEMFSWLCMAARFRSKHWLHGLTAEPFLKFVDFILGDRVWGIQVPSAAGEAQRVKPDWAIVLAFEHKLRKEAMKKVTNEGFTLSEALAAVIRDPDLKEAYFTTPIALKAATSTEAPPNKWFRLNDKGNKGRRIVDEANFFVSKCFELCLETVRANGHFLLEHPEDLGLVQDERPGSIWQWPELRELLIVTHSCSFAIHQCQFGADTPKPTRFATSMPVSDPRCFCSLPVFDKVVGDLDKPAIAQASLGGLDKPAIAQVSCVNKATIAQEPCKDLGKASVTSSQPAQSSSGDCGSCLVVIDLEDDEGNKGAVPLEDSHDSFDMQACLNRGTPMVAEWDNKSHEFIDGFGLCSPTRWHPLARGERRTQVMRDLATKTFELLEAFVVKHIRNPRQDAFKLVTGKLESSPFPQSDLQVLRVAWAQLLPDPKDALVVEPGQPFSLRAISQWLKVFEDPDVSWLVDERDSFASGVPIGVDEPLPRSPQVFGPKVRHRKLDESEFNPLAFNYPSGQLSCKELEEKFREEESLGPAEIAAVVRIAV
ncbi:Fucoxanthin-chlorophyll a-c binding protein C, partial [Durusdinium trenchii]